MTINKIGVIFYYHGRSFVINYNNPYMIIVYELNENGSKEFLRTSDTNSKKIKQKIEKAVLLKKYGKS